MTFYLRKLEKGTLENNRLFEDLTKRVSDWAPGYPGERGWQVNSEAEAPTRGKSWQV